jgi:hypothetical protein
MTKWFKPLEKLPIHNEQVLIREGDFIELATYNSSTKLFDLRNGTTRTSNDGIIWMELLRAEET